MDHPLAVDSAGQRLLGLRTAEEPLDRDVDGTPCPLALVVLTSARTVLLGLNRWRQEWDLPGGMIEPGETPRQAACRELQKETGVPLRAAQLSWSGLAVFDLLGPPRRELAAVFLSVLAVKPPLLPSEELVEVQWFDLQLPPAGHSPLDLAVARAALAAA